MVAGRSAISSAKSKVRINVLLANHFRLPHSVHAVGSVLALALLAACGGGSTATTPVGSGSVTTLATATNTLCVTPSTSAQTVALPATGGVSGTISFGAYPAAATGCDSVTIATGADVLTAQSVARSVQSVIPEASTTSGTVLMTISVGQAFGSSGPVGAFGFSTIISGMQFTASPNLNFPNGTYYATITVSGQTFLIPLTANNGVLNVQTGSAGSLPIPVLANTSALITLYKQGVTPPSPTPTSSTPLPTPSSGATALPTAAGQPVPNGTTIGSATLTIEGQPNNTNGTMTTTSIVYNASTPYYQVSVVNGGILPGNTTYTISGLNVESYRIDGCTGQIGYGGTGVQGTFTVPFPSGAGFQVSDTCEVELFSVPASVVNADPNHGFGYDLFQMFSPVTQTTAPYAPAINT